jgi:hypothetical protein
MYDDRTKIRDFILNVHVANRYRWNRAKTILACVWALCAVACIGGLEGFAPMPSPLGAVLFLGLALYTASHIEVNWGLDQNDKGR